MTPFEWTAFAVVVVTSASRLTRLLTYDHFPPVRRFRDWYVNATDGNDWQLLMLCGYCMSFWVTLAVVLSANWIGVIHIEMSWKDMWWLLMGTLGASYIAAIMMAKDGDDGDDD